MCVGVGGVRAHAQELVCLARTRSPCMYFSRLERALLQLHVISCRVCRWDLVDEEQSLVSPCGIHQPVCVL